VRTAEGRKRRERRFRHRRSLLLNPSSGKARPGVRGIGTSFRAKGTATATRRFVESYAFREYGRATATENSPCSSNAQSLTTTQRRARPATEFTFGSGRRTRLTLRSGSRERRLPNLRPLAAALTHLWFRRLTPRWLPLRSSARCSCILPASRFRQKMHVRRSGFPLHHVRLSSNFAKVTWRNRISRGKSYVLAGKDARRRLKSRSACERRAVGEPLRHAGPVGVLNGSCEGTPPTWEWWQQCSRRCQVHRKGMVKNWWP